MKDNLIIILSVLLLFFMCTTIFNFAMWNDCYRYIESGCE